MAYTSWPPFIGLGAHAPVGQGWIVSTDLPALLEAQRNQEARQFSIGAPPDETDLSTLDPWLNEDVDRALAVCDAAISRRSDLRRRTARLCWGVFSSALVMLAICVAVLGLWEPQPSYRLPEWANPITCAGDACDAVRLGMETTGSYVTNAWSAGYCAPSAEPCTFTISADGTGVNR